MRKIILFLISLLILTACNNKVDDNVQGCDIFECADTNTTGEVMTFKGKYEFFNGSITDDEKVNRTVIIPEDHPYVKVQGKDILKMIENKETFYLYVGDEQCPWCRSVIEKSIEVSKQFNIDTIYYIEIWDDDGNEIFRDKYIYEDNELKQVFEGDESYQKLLEYFNDFLSDYTLTVDNKTIEVNEKRIYAPNFFYVENGVLKKMTTGTSSLQKDSREELSEEMLKEEEELFRDFFTK